MTKLKSIPPPMDPMFKDPEKLTPEDRASILAKLRATAQRYRAARALQPQVAKGEEN